jgi:hypothetical protein
MKMVEIPSVQRHKNIIFASLFVNTSNVPGTMPYTSYTLFLHPYNLLRDLVDEETDSENLGGC